MSGESLITNFLSGVIEGFYGQPWTHADRLELFDWMARWGLNTYLYAPKDDLHHRALWREAYSTSDAEPLAQLIQACRERNLRFVYALSPGLDIHYSNDTELRQLQTRVEQMLALGCEHFSLLFDDISDRLDTEDIRRYGSLASAQCRVANALFTCIRDRKPGGRFVLCPTAYCGRMADAGLGGEGYLATLGRELLPEIDVFWTGPDIVSREITVAHVKDLQSVLQRKPLIWDNLHANDYDARRFFCGPYSGRPRELRNEVSGVLSNPNNEFPLNYVPLRTLAEFVRCERPWDPRNAYLAAMREWFASFATIGRPIALEDLILFGDCYYLPHEEGPDAEALYERARRVLARDPAEWGDDAENLRGQAARLREFCERVTELRRRRLFHALYRRVSELRHELDLVERRVGFTSAGEHQEVPCDRGMVARLHRLLG